MPHLELRRGSFENWFVLEGGGNWASVEGDHDEWRAIAKGLRSGNGARFKRADAHRSGDAWVFYSPRNAAGDRDRVRLPVEDGGRLADHIDRVLDAWAFEQIGEAFEGWQRGGK